jgi:hypothetical protein
MTSTTSGLSIRKYIRALRDYTPPTVRSSSHEVRRNLKSKVAEEYRGVDDSQPYNVLYQSHSFNGLSYESV